MSKYSERLRSAFYAQAVADAMGERFEFCSPTVEEVRAFINSDEPIHITDDTQMALFGQEAVVWASLDNRIVNRADIVAAYLRWYDTQTGSGAKHSGLAALPAMWQVRAPGATCMSSLSALSRNLTAVIRMGAGCGPVMRLFPFAALYLLSGTTVKSIQKICRKSCKVTHSHPTALAAVQRYVNAATHLINTGVSWSLASNGGKITDYGKGWRADECVAMAVWAVRNARDYDHLLELTIAHPGDSDSVAAVAGSLWGLAGFDGYEKYLPRLAERNVVDYVLEGVA